MTDPKNTSPAGTGGKSLKDQYRWQLWLIIAVNSLFFYGVVQANAIKVDGLRAIFTDTSNLAPIGIALVISTVLNGFLSADNKARLVFLRWRNPLPGHRVFSEYAVSDPRIDLAELFKIHGGDLPFDPVEQNRVWYRMFKSIEKEPAINQAHRDFLLLRDYTGLSFLFFLFLGAAGLCAIPSAKVGATYLVVLALQYVVVRQAASNCGIRFATTVLALKAVSFAGKTVPKKAVSKERL
jgi:hypothetical protein